MKCSRPLKALLSCKILPPGSGQVGTEGHQEPEQRVALEPGSPLAIAGQTGGETAP